MEKILLNEFFNGECLNAYDFFGAQKNHNGYNIRLYAPNALNINVIYKNKKIEMEKVDPRGIFFIYIENMSENDTYMYEVIQIHQNKVIKIDPFSYAIKNKETLIVSNEYNWNDETWMKNRDLCLNKPLNIYEMHFNCFKEQVTYENLSKDLIPYLKQHHYTHVELMPIFEYPYDGSWGYQSSGFYAPTNRYGTPNQLRAFIDECHCNNIGVILDFVCVHFASDEYALTKFDGTSLYEYTSSKNAYSEWGSPNFDFSKKEVRSFLMSAANYWICEYHIDGLRMDAISNIIYFQGNRDRGINTKGLSFIKKMNQKLKEKHPAVMLIAEDSTAFPNVCKKVSEGGLGFDYKWDMGWMHDTLSYFSKEPKLREKFHHEITFSMYYFYNENYLLELSHDEVVHGKKTIVDKMYGTYEEKFAQARLLYLYMYTHPGKKLNFMGNEIAMFREFDEHKVCDFELLKYDMHKKFNDYIKELMLLYVSDPHLYENEYEVHSFKWIEVDNNKQSIFAYMRNNTYIVVLNMSNNYYKDHLLEVECGIYEEILNSDDYKYGGNTKIKKNYDENKLLVDLPPYSGLLLKYKGN